MEQKLREVMKAFVPEAEMTSFVEIPNGNINHTYRINTTGNQDYIAQCVNTNVFRKPMEVMANIDAVTTWIIDKMPDSDTICFERTQEGKNYLFDTHGAFWRVFNFIDSVTYNKCDDLTVIRNAGEAFGRFQTALNDFDAASLYVTIPDFHNTIARYEAFEDVIRRDPAKRVCEVAKEIEALREMREGACTLEAMYRAGKLPLRVTHNDTKINNVLFDRVTHKALTIIDLDTVMPGLMGHDFGDAIRFAANYVEEDSTDAEHAGINLDVFRAFTKGFLAGVGDSITENEANTLALSCAAMACELSTRFLGDYIAGDPYFKIRYPEHNLVRARCQIALARNMFSKMDEMNAIVHECLSN